MKYIQLEKPTEGITILTLSRPESYNSFSPELLYELSEALESLKDDKETRVLIITGAGEKAFSTGVDLKYLQKIECIEDAREFALLLEGTSEKIFNFPKPVISAINGYVMGGGLGFAASTDYRVVSEKAKLGFPAVKLGAILPVTCTLYLKEIIGLNHSRDLLLTGRMIEAEEALEMGLVNKITVHEDVVKESIKVAEQMLQGSDMALFYTKRTLNNILSKEIETQKLYAADNFAFLSQTKEWKERMANFGKK
jgi:enoyl-CoA hydratase